MISPITPPDVFESDGCEHPSYACCCHGWRSEIPYGMVNSPDSYHERVKDYSPDRIAPFNSANKRSPQARKIEQQLLIQRLDLRPGQRVLDTGSGGGYLVDGFPKSLRDTGTIICSDASEHFIATVPKPFLPIVCGMDAFPLSRDSMDRVCNLAGLHHVEYKDRFFREAARVLKSGGLIAVADVRSGTRPARWLNGPVDRFTDIGHDGMFVAEGEFSALLEKAGFSEIEEKHEIYPWSFEGWEELVDFCRDLFRLAKATREDIEAALEECLVITRDREAVTLEWELTYATGRIPE
ncbi:class I SAM-dependent methyltransferase [Aestuariibius sp. 2305UL40-4]|uniref:class I SAM-dependent methyltransferase n=1 Tax=Aestuariibius violaceus TaxID=3234132 RepID=UPI00347F81C2